MLLPPEHTYRKIFTFGQSSESLSFLPATILLTKNFPPAVGITFQDYRDRGAETYILEVAPNQPLSPKIWRPS